jgi:hypothetical protein
MRSALLVVASTLLALGLAEGGLRLVRPLWAVPYPPVCLVPGLFQDWPPYGYRLWPSRTQPMAVRAWASHPVTVTANADGFRERRELRPGDGRPRLVVLGDSLVFGVGVEEPERFTEILQERRPGWRVDNLGMLGYGPDLMLRAFEQVGVGLAPHAALVTIFSDDFRRVVPFYQGVGFALPRYVVGADGALASVPYPKPGLLDRLLLVQGIRYVRWRYTDATFPLNGAILARFVADAASHGIRLGVAFTPGPTDDRADARRRDLLAATAAADGVPFVDLTPALRAAGSAAAYLPNDVHWSAAGHRVVADVLGPWLDAHLMGGA